MILLLMVGARQSAARAGMAGLMMALLAALLVFDYGEASGRVTAVILSLIHI